VGQIEEKKLENITRSFRLQGEDQINGLMRFIRLNIDAHREAGAPLVAVVMTEKRKRKAEQNKYYWGVVVKGFASNVPVGGVHHLPMVWHEYLANKFLGCVEITDPFGAQIIRRRSTTDLSVKEFAEYTTQCEAFGAAEFGILWPAKEEAA
jgi:hypothetical protein